MITYKLDESGIYYVDFSEIVSLQDIEKFISNIKDFPNLTNDFVVLYDLREATLQIRLSDIFHINKLAKQATERFSSVNAAYVVDIPSITAYSIIFSEKLAPQKTKRKVFSTIDAAISWLKN